MSDYRAPIQDMRFLLFKVFNSESFWSSLLPESDLDSETVNAILEEAAKVCEQVVAPLNREADEQGCHLMDGKVQTPDGFTEAYQAFCEGGWGGLGGDPDYGGMGMPKSLVCVVEEMLQGASLSFGLAPMLTAGACLSILSHASEELKSLYLPKMYSGEWSGAMDLTEPHAGTDLGLIKTKAEPVEGDRFKITGSKIFITWGEHEMSENIVHLVLAKLPGAPDGSKGISMFLVPKFLPDAHGEPGERNAISCGALEKKMGIHGSATCVMNYDGAFGWLVGEENRGLQCMFTMMNYERLVVGIQAMAAAEHSYQTARDYARERVQGRSPKGVQASDQQADPIIVHPDVRRMLMLMKANNEASRAFYVYLAQYLDLAKFSEDKVKRQQAENRVALLTPVCKAFLTDLALDTSVTGQQVLGGHGFIREWGQEQLVRDIRITQIYEGTNGVQAMDLVGRKTVACKGALLAEYLADIYSFIAENENTLNDLEFYGPLRKSLQLMQSVTETVIKSAAEDADSSGAVAVDYLHLLGYVSYAYMWARMSCVLVGEDVDSDFMDSKVKTARFFFSKLLPKAEMLSESISSGSVPVMALSDDQF